MIKTTYDVNISSDSNEHNAYSSDVFNLPVGIPITIKNIVYYKKFKWYNPISWFKKYYSYVYQVFKDTHTH